MQDLKEYEAIISKMRSEHLAEVLFAQDLIKDYPSINNIF